MKYCTVSFNISITLIILYTSSFWETANSQNLDAKVLTRYLPYYTGGQPERICHGHREAGSAGLARGRDSKSCTFCPSTGSSWPVAEASWSQTFGIVQRQWDSHILLPCSPFEVEEPAAQGNPSSCMTPGAYTDTCNISMRGQLLHKCCWLSASAPRDLVPAARGLHQHLSQISSHIHEPRYHLQNINWH